MNDGYQASSSSGFIAVAPESAVADWARWCSKGRKAPVEALDVGGLPRTVFVPDHVLVDGDDASLVARLVDRYGAELVPSAPLPPPPEGLIAREGVDFDAMPLPTLLRLTDPPAASSRAAELLHAAFEPPVSVTSEAAAGLLGLVAELAADGHQIGLDIVGQVTALPLLAPLDWNPVQTLAVPAYAGRARIGAAWQLVEAFRQFRPTKSPVTIGVMDGGFWLDGLTPNVAPRQPASDFGSSVWQLNLLDESVGAGGASGIKNGDGYNAPWHGNGVASIAAAKVGNGLGAAGVGGTVAQPVLFKTDLSLNDVFRCLHVCLAWGIDVLNMSWNITEWEFVFPNTAWERSFQFAVDNGLIMVAAAGNDETRLPEDDNPRPATRTPGTITVGALDAAEQAALFSNFGSSIDVWAPGTNLPVIPDDISPVGSSIDGTSAAAPFVSGILAMMRAVAPSLDPGRAKQILHDSGWKGAGKVGVGVDAYAAVLAAMGGRLPDDDSETNNTPQTARPLTAGPGGRLTPSHARSAFCTLSSGSDADWYRFDVTAFSRLDLQLRFYPLLGAVSLTLEPDEPSSRALPELTVSGSSGFTRLTGLLAPGGYKLHVRGSLNLYAFTVDLVDAPLAPDQFEVNDTFDASTRFLLREPGAPPRIFPDPGAPRPHAAGVYDLSLHTPGDRDFFRIDAEVINPLSEPVVRVALTDAPLDVALYDAERRSLERHVGVRQALLKLPRAATAFVEVTGAQPTRYRLRLGLEVDPTHLPGPLQESPSIPMPDLGDPAFRIDEEVRHVLFEADEVRQRTGRLALAAIDGQPLSVDLLDATGRVVRTAVRRDDALHESVELDVAGLEPGAHLLRVAHAGAATFATAGPLNVERLPTLR